MGDWAVCELCGSVYLGMPGARDKATRCCEQEKCSINRQIDLYAKKLIREAQERCRALREKK